MRGEENYSQRSRSRSLGVIALMLALFIFQVTVFTVNAVKEHKLVKVQSQNHDPANTDAQFYNSRNSIADSTWSVGSNSNYSSGNRSKKYHSSERFKRNADKGKKPAERFEFNPNIISLDSLCLLGLSSRQAQTILNYRNKGGIFRKPQDFAKMYVVSDELYAQLAPYIVIPTQYPKSGNTTTYNTQTALSNAYPGTDSILTEANGMEVMKSDSKSQEEFDKRPLVIELNSADSTKLVKLYGIGGYYAKKIIAYRNRVGNFYTPEQLMEIDGLDSLRYAGFAKNVTADPAAIRRFRLDTAGKHFLIRHPYIGAYAARGIILLREKFGTAACSLQNLVKEKILTPQAAEKLWYYIIE